MVDDKLRTLVPLMELKSPLTGTRAVSLPFTDCCDPLFQDASELAPVLDEIFVIGSERGWRYLEFRGEVDLLRSSFQALGWGSGQSGKGDTLSSEQPAVSSQTDGKSPGFWGHELDLKSKRAIIWSRMDSSVRRAIRRSERQGLKVGVYNDPEAVQVFYRIHEATRRRHGLPPQPYRFFELIREHLLRHDGGFLVLAWIKGRREELGAGGKGEVDSDSGAPPLASEIDPVAGALFLHHGKHAVYKFAASYEQYQALRPNNLVIWRAIQHLWLTGHHALDFGRTSIQQEGLRQFKLRWGCRECRMEIQRWSVENRRRMPLGDQAFGWHNHLFRRMPYLLNRCLGQLTYPHLQ